ncbi:hypothetical protein EMIT047CA2_100124 [Pseudomonas soli]
MNTFIMIGKPVKAILAMFNSWPPYCALASISLARGELSITPEAFNMLRREVIYTVFCRF